MAEKVCFLISPMGDDGSRTRSRADFVYATYVEPACREAGYKPLRSQDDTTDNIVAGITSSLQNAPMAIAYLGGPCCREGDDEDHALVYWNANVMIEVGLRNATKLPLVYLCDKDDRGRMPPLPLSLQQTRVVGLPAVPPPAGQPWADPNPARAVSEVVGRIRGVEGSPRYLDSVHPLVDINASSRADDSPENLFYACASWHAERVFGKRVSDGQNHRPRLIGLTMNEFLDTVKARMHPVQWAMFSDDQARARQELRDRIGDRDKKVCKARVPIVFETHDTPEFVGRAYLPVIVREFTPERSNGGDWYNVRVLYLNVTGVTRQVRNDAGETYYVCDYDPTSDAVLGPLPRPIEVFLSYSHVDRDEVRAVYDMLAGLAPHVRAFIDRVDIEAGAIFARQLQERLPAADVAFVFVGANPGPGQRMEVDAVVGLLLGGKYHALPVLLDGVNGVPTAWSFLNTIQWVKREALTADGLRRVFSGLFPDRCPPEWGRMMVPLARPSAEAAGSAR